MEGRILVVNANDMVLDVIQEMLGKIGYAVTPVSDGHRALAKALSGRYDLIIVDRCLTGDLDGVGLVERLRKYGVRSSIIGTAPDGAWHVPRGSMYGAVDHLLPSPFDYGDLIEAVKTYVPCSASPAFQRNETPSDAEDEPDGVPTPRSATPEPSPTPETTPRSSFSPLPVRRADAAPRLPNRVRSDQYSPRRDVGNAAPRPGPARILVVETDEDDRRTVAGDLTEAGYDVSALRGGQEAYENTMLSDYDLVLTDLWLVGMDGFEMIEAMRKSGVTSPIAVRTAYITRDMVRELLEWRVSKIVLKSAQKATLLSSVGEIVPIN